MNEEAEAAQEVQAEAQAEEVVEEMGEQPQPEPEPDPSAPAETVATVGVSVPVFSDVYAMSAQAFQESRTALQSAKDAIPTHEEAHNLLAEQHSAAVAEAVRIEGLLDQSVAKKDALIAKIDTAEAASKEAASVMIRVLQGYVDG